MVVDSRSYNPLGFCLVFVIFSFSFFLVVPSKQELSFAVGRFVTGSVHKLWERTSFQSLPALFPLRTGLSGSRKQALALALALPGWLWVHCVLCSPFPLGYRGKISAWLVSGLPRYTSMPCKLQALAQIEEAVFICYAWECPLMSSVFFPPSPCHIRSEV